MASLGDLIVRVGANIQGFEQAMGTVSQRLGAIDRDVNKKLSGFDKLGARLTALGTGLTAAVTLPVAAGLTVATTAFGNFENALNRIEALGGITGDALEQLRQQAVDLGAQTKFSALEAAEGMAFYAQAGFNATQISQAMAATLDLAAVSQISVGEAAKLTSDTLGQFGLAASESGRVADVLARAGKEAKASIGEMGLTLTYVGPQAKQLGLSLEETVAAIVALDAAGIRGEKAGTGLRQVLKSLTAPSGEAAKALDQLKVKITDASGATLPFAEIMEQVRVGLQKFQTDAEKQEVIFRAFGSEAGNVASILGNLGRGLDDTTAKLNDTGVTARAQADVINKGFNAAMERLKGSVETAAIVLGGTLAPAIIQVAEFLEGAANKVAEFGKWFGTLPEPVKTTAIALVAMAAAVGPVTVGLGVLANSITSIVGAARLVTGVIGTAGAAGTLTGALAGLPVMLSTVSKAALDAFVLFPSKIPSSITLVTGLWNALKLIPQVLATIAAQGASAFVGLIGQLGNLATAIKTLALAQFTALGASMANIVFALQNNLVAALTVGEKALLALGQAAILAAGAFVGWKLGQWAYDQIPGFKALGDAIADTFLKLPGGEALLLKLSGASTAAARAQEDLASSVKQLEDRLKAKDIVVDRAGKSLDEYAKALQKAAKDAGVATGDIEKAFKTLGVTSKEQLTKNIREAKAAFDLINRAYKEGRASAEDLNTAQKALNKIIAESGGAGRTGAAGIDAVSDSAKRAEEQYKRTAAAFLAGKASAEQLSNAQIKLRQAQDSLNPERVLQRHQQAWDEMQNRYDALLQFFISTATRIKELDREIEESIRQRTTTFKRAYDEMFDKAKEEIKITVSLDSRLPAEVREAIKATQELGETAKRVGAISIAEYERMADEAVKDHERMRDSGKFGAEEVLKARKRALEAQIAAARAAGREITAEQRKELENIEDQLDKSSDRQVGIWRSMKNQVSTIITDLSRDIAAAFIGIFKSNPENERLREEEQELRESLITRQTEYEEFVANVARELESIRETNAEELAQAEADLAESLAEQEAAYNAFVDKVNDALTDNLNEQAENEQALRDLQRNLRERSDEYEIFMEAVPRMFEDLRSANRESLQDELDDLSDNLRDRVEEYQDFVEDVNTKLRRLGTDTEDDIGDETRQTGRKISDRQKDFQRDEQDILARIARLQRENKASNNEEIAELRLTLQRKREDLNEFIRRENEDLNDFIEEKRRKQREEEEDARESLERRARDHAQFVAEHNERVAAVTQKHAEDLLEQENDLRESIRRRAEDYTEFVTNTNRQLERLRQDGQKLKDEEAELRNSLVARASAWEQYVIDAAAELQSLRNAAAARLSEQERDLQASLDAAANDWENYRNETIRRLEEIGDEYVTVFDRIKDAFGSMLESVAESVVRIFVENVLQKGILGKDGLLGGLLSKVTGWLGGLFGGLFGGGGGGLLGGLGGNGGPFGGLPSIFGETLPGPPGTGGAESALGATSGFTSAFSNPITGAITAAALAAQAAASVFSAIKGNGDSGKIEVTTREIKAEVVNLRNDEWDRHGKEMLKWDEHHTALLTKLDQVKEIFGGDVGEPAWATTLSTPLVQMRNAILGINSEGQDTDIPGLAEALGYVNASLDTLKDTAWRSEGTLQLIAESTVKMRSVMEHMRDLTREATVRSQQGLFSLAQSINGLRIQGTIQNIINLDGRLVAMQLTPYVMERQATLLRMNGARF